MRVFATRPEKHNLTWCALLQNHNLMVQPLSLLEIIPAESETERQNVKTRILELDQYFAVIFVSQNAVEYGMPWIDQYWPQLPVGLSWFAIGNKTAQQLRQHPLMVAESIQIPDGTWNSEALLALPLLQSERVGDQKVLIFRGVGGRTLLADRLQARGAIVDYGELYYRRLPIDTQRKAQTLSLAPDNDVIPVFSGESLENFCELFVQEKHQWEQLNIIVPGERVAALAYQRGFKKITVAENASEEKMLAALLQVAQTKE